MQHFLDNLGKLHELEDGDTDALEFLTTTHPGLTFTQLSKAEADARRAPTVQGMWERIKQERDRLRFDGGVKVGAYWFKSTKLATSEYNSIVQISSGIPDTTVLRAGWRTMDGTTVDMTPALAKQILTAGFAQVAAIDDVAQAHMAAVEKVADPAAYDFSTGWPATFPGLSRASSSTNKGV